MNTFCDEKVQFIESYVANNPVVFSDVKQDMLSDSRLTLK